MAPWARRAALAASLALSLGAADRASAGTLNVDWNSGCAATCFGAHGAYTLTFSASAFSGPVDISKLLLDRRVLGSMASSFFSVSFTLDGHQIASWGNWNMGSVAGDQLTLSGSDLMWNPADGDLVLTFQLVAPNGEVLGADKGGFGFFGDSGFTDVTTPPPGQGSGGEFDLVVPPPEDLPPIIDEPSSDGPSDGPPSNGPPSDGTPNGGQPIVSAVPEPSVWALVIGGFGLAGATLRRRRSAAAA